jgi:hypothetical protein
MNHLAEVARIIDLIEARDEFIMGDDGYVVFWPEGYRLGAFPSWVLRAIADELDRRNAAWDAQIQFDLCLSTQHSPTDEQREHVEREAHRDQVDAAGNRDARQDETNQGDDDKNEKERHGNSPVR